MKPEPVNYLYQVLAAETQRWRGAGYPSDGHPMIGEILEYQTDAGTGSLGYEMVFTDTVTIPHDKTAAARAFVQGRNAGRLYDKPPP